MENTNIIHFNPFSCENNYLKLVDSQLNGNIVENATFTSCFFSVGVWKKMVFRNCNFNSCVFDTLDLSACIFENCNFSYCRWDACKWVSSTFKSVDWKKCHINHGQWIMCNLDDATTQFVDDYSDEEEVMQNTATWTLSRKIVHV